VEGPWGEWMNAGEALSKWKTASLDLESPRGAKKEESALLSTPHVLLTEDGECVGHAAFRRVGSCIELHSVVIATHLRGRGRSHVLLEMALSRWSQDRILNGSSVQPSVDLAAAVRGEEPIEIPWRRDLICFTRHPSLAASLIAAGFNHSLPKRRWWSLWLRRHPLGRLSSRTMLSILFNRLIRGLKLLFSGEDLPKGAKRPGFIKLWMQRHRRLFHQLTYLSANRLFILKADADVSVGVRSQDEEDMQDRLQGMGLDISIHTHDRRDSKSTQDSESWDSGNVDETPFIDLTEEE